MVVMGVSRYKAMVDPKTIFSFNIKLVIQLTVCTVIDTRLDSHLTCSTARYFFIIFLLRHLHHQLTTLTRLHGSGKKLLWEVNKSNWVDGKTIAKL